MDLFKCITRLALAFLVIAIQVTAGTLHSGAASLAYPWLEAEHIYNIQVAADLYAALEDAQVQNASKVVLVLPPSTLTLNATLDVRVSCYIQGADNASAVTPSSVIRCGAGGYGLITFSGQELVISHVQLQDCSRAGLHVEPSSNGTILIEDSVFTNFTRTLVCGPKEA